MKTFKYRIYPNKEQKRTIENTLSTCCLVYNLALEQRIKIWTNQKKSIGKYQQQKQLVELKDAYPEIKVVYAQVLQTVIGKLDISYQNFFRRLKQKATKAGFPRFKSRDRYNSYTYPQIRNISIQNNRIGISKLGEVKIKYHRPFEGQPKTLTIVKNNDQYFVTIACELDVSIPKITARSMVGIDLGLSNFVTCSDGQVFDNPRFLRKSEDKLTKAQKKHSNKTKGSKNRNNSRKRLAKIHNKIRNQRQDFLHKLSRQLVNKYDILVFEDLNIKSMVKNHNLAKSINDASWNNLINQCIYKAEDAGKYVIKVDPRDTTKTCSRCGHKMLMPLWQRTYDCPECGLVLDRDRNASNNVLQRYLSTVGTTEIQSFGERSLDCSRN